MRDRNGCNMFLVFYILGQPLNGKDVMWSVGNKYMTNNRRWQYFWAHHSQPLLQLTGWFDTG